MEIELQLFQGVVTWELNPLVTRLKASIKLRSTMCMCIFCCCQGGEWCQDLVFPLILKCLHLFHAISDC